ncbi:MAG: PorP/SprF family type IX secretion system membrane protein [Bacteroidales bacterium]|nr:PorP/SprF family type IX secretion system membrane protein [Bacteroidales bacterium]
MKKLGIILLLSVFAGGLFAQQIPQLSFRHQNLMIQNPAAAGTSLGQEIKILHRQQWVGFDNAPTTSFISYQQNFRKTNGLGGYLISDRTFPTSRFIVNASYSYIIEMDDVKLAFGLAALVMQYRFKNTDLSYRELGDPSLDFSTDQKWRPEANAGLLVYGNNFYGGFSISQLIKSGFRPFSTGDYGLVQMNRHFCISGQYDFYAGQNRISPGIFAEYVKSAPFISEYSVYYSFDNMIYGSATYRFADALCFAVGYRYERFYLAYSFDIVTSSLRNANSGSHEIMFAVNISGTKTNTPMFSSGGSSRRNSRNSGRIFY